MNKQKMWKDWEIDFLKTNYSKLTMVDIIQQLDRTYSSITNKAHALGLENRSTNLSNISNLLSESNEAYYWLGFLLADGHFSKNNNQIQINLSIKDIEHLRNFARFVEYEKELIAPSLHISDINIVPKIKELYEIKSDKTYNPPNITFLSGDSLFSLVIGFIDGDGSIKKDGYLYIKVHNSWLNVIDFMISNINKIGKHTIKTNKEGLAICTLTNIEATKKIKEHAEKLKLPILKRKWDRITPNKLSKKELRDKYEMECINHFESGLTPKEVLGETTISYSFIKKTFKNYKAIKAKDIKRDIERAIN